VAFDVRGVSKVSYSFGVLLQAHAGRAAANAPKLPRAESPGAHGGGALQRDVPACHSGYLCTPESSGSALFTSSCTDQDFFKKGAPTFMCMSVRFLRTFTIRCRFLKRFTSRCRCSNKCTGRCRFANTGRCRCAKKWKVVEVVQEIVGPLWGRLSIR